MPLYLILSIKAIGGTCILIKSARWLKPLHIAGVWLWIILLWNSEAAAPDEQKKESVSFETLSRLPRTLEFPHKPWFALNFRNNLRNQLNCISDSPIFLRYVDTNWFPLLFSDYFSCTFKVVFDVVNSFENRISVDLISFHSIRFSYYVCLRLSFFFSEMCLDLFVSVF